MPQSVITHLQFIVEKLRDKATVFTFHGDAVLQGLALAQIGGNFFPTGDYNMRLRTYQDEEGGLVTWCSGGWCCDVLVCLMT